MGVTFFNLRTWTGKEEENKQKSDAEPTRHDSGNIIICSRIIETISPILVNDQEYLSPKGLNIILSPADDSHPLRSQ